MTKEPFVINRILLNLEAYFQMSWPIMLVCFKILQYCPILSPAAVLISVVEEW